MKLIETKLGKKHDDRSWCWRARGLGLAQYLGAAAWQKYSSEDWIFGGPFPSRRAAERACDMLEREFLREMFNIKIKHAPAPTLH